MCPVIKLSHSKVWILIWLHMLQFQGSLATHSPASRCVTSVLQGQLDVLRPHHVLWYVGCVVERGRGEAKQGVNRCLGHVPSTDKNVPERQHALQQGRDCCKWTAVWLEYVRVVGLGSRWHNHLQ